MIAQAVMCAVAIALAVAAAVITTLELRRWRGQ
jgi:hypothetical protein